jgi:hypothetical protein
MSDPAARAMRGMRAFCKNDLLIESAIIPKSDTAETASVARSVYPKTSIFHSISTCKNFASRYAGER